MLTRRIDFWGYRLTLETFLVLILRLHEGNNSRRDIEGGNASITHRVHF